jgi:superfamily II DNA or RNA helicase
VIPPIVELRDAIEFGRLCPYEYYVHLVDLNEDEKARYRELTTRIGQVIGSSDGQAPPDGYAQFLLIQRARIIKQAEAKAPVAAEIVTREFRDGESWLVYCDDRLQVREVLSRLRDAGLDAYEYHSAMQGNRDATMEHFRSFGGILVAIRCLDEGVDLPEVTHAVIAASSRNTREFIQRRGRVLRTAPGKRAAFVHDLLVRPPMAEDKDKNPYGSIAEAEIARAAEFARDASNVATRTKLMGLCLEWGIDPGQLI